MIGPGAGARGSWPAIQRKGPATRRSAKPRTAPNWPQRAWRPATRSWCSSVANRDGARWEDPGEFRLHRFADSAFRQFTPRSDILPFGAGKHHCTGSLLALMEMEVVIYRFMDRVRWAEWVNGPPPMVGSSLRSPTELKVRLIPA